MIALKTILLPTDGSACSGKAMAHALAFAQRFRARVVALHVMGHGWEGQTRRTFGEVRQNLLQEAGKRHEEEARGIVAALRLPLLT